MAILKSLGILLYYPELGLDNQVLDPEWLSGAIYTIITSDTVHKQQGEVRLQQLPAIFSDAAIYPESQHRYILQVAAQFELCYFLDDKTALFPDRLPEDQLKNSNWTNDGSSVLFRYQFEFLPRVVFPRLLAKMHGSLKELTAWRTGAIMTQESCGNIARVMVNYTSKTIDVEITGSDPKDLFREILHKMDAIFETFQRFQVKELISVGVDARGNNKLKEYRELAMLAERGETNRTYGDLADPVNITLLLDSIETQDSRQDRFLRDAMRTLQEGFKAAGQAGENIHIINHSTSSATATAHVNVTITVEAKNQSVDELGQHLEMLLEDMQDALTELKQESDPKKVASSKAGLRLKRLYDDLVDKGSHLNTALNKLDKGWQTASGLARHYNSIADWTLGALPRIPEPLLKKKE